MDDTLKEYFLSVGVTDEKEQFIKSAEIDVLLAITAFDVTGNTLKNDLKKQWNRIIDRDVVESDCLFIESRWGNYPFAILTGIKRNGLLHISEDDQLNYLRRIWFFAFLSKNYRQISLRQLADVITSCKRKEIECGYFDSSRRNYVPDVLKRIYSNNPEISLDQRKVLWDHIATYYLNDLVKIFDDAKELLLKNNNEYDNWFKIFTLIPFEDIPLTIVKKQTEKNIEQKPIEKVDAETTQKTGESEAIKTDKSTDTDNEQQPASAEDAASSQDKQSTEEVHALIKHLENEQHENPSLEFERAIDKVVDLSQILSDSLKNDGLESFAKTLNSTAYANLLDKVYFATSEKEEMSKDFLSIAILLKNALSEFGYSFEYYPKESLGCCIGAPSDDDIEYISNNYRWKSDNILYKNLYISAPGLMNRRTKTFVYPPLVEVK